MLPFVYSLSRSNMTVKIKWAADYTVTDSPVNTSYLAIGY